MSKKHSLQAGPDAKSQINSIKGEKGSEKLDPKNNSDGRVSISKARKAKKGAKSVFIIEDEVEG